jgi:sulfite exporter TauE/SafE
MHGAEMKLETKAFLKGWLFIALAILLIWLAVNHQVHNLDLFR